MRSRESRRSADVGHRAAALKERIYVTFTALAVLVALELHHEGPGEAAVTMVVTVVAAVLAMFLAEVLAHVVVHEAVPRRGEVAQFARVSAGAAGALLLPVAALLAAEAGWWSVETAFSVAKGLLLLTLVLVGFLAVRRLGLGRWQLLLVLTAEFALGAVVLLLLVLAKA